MNDDRKISWAEIEADVQRAGQSKDPEFRLHGEWKLYVRTLADGTVVYAVDGGWVRNNLSIIFGHGGHGLVHESIPLDEIWVSDRHQKSCECRGVRADLAVSENFFNSTVLHEHVELKAMRDGDDFWTAHQKALAAERDAGMLDDPFTEKY
jgi:hypothetical protein